jgi:hypothetical protein
MFRKKRLSNPSRQKQAIEYVVELDKLEFNRFIDSVKLIWEGYDKLYRVKTRDEKEAIKEAKEDGDDFILEKEEI